MRSIVPRGDGTPEDDYPTRVQQAVFGYVRGQLLFSLIMGTSAGLMLWIMGSLGVFPRGQDVRAGVRRVLRLRRADPVHRAGDRRGAADARSRCSPTTRSTRSGSRSCSRSLQQIEGHIVAPTVFSQALRINPLLVIFALLIGGRLYGFAGAFLALPLAAVAARERRLLPRAPRARAVGDAHRRRARRGARPGPPPARRRRRGPPSAPPAAECGARRGPSARRGVLHRVRHRARGDDEAAAAASAAPS